MSIRVWWGHVTAMVTGTVAVLGRLLPTLLVVALVGWIGHQVLLRASILVAAQTWLAILLLAAALVIQLGSIVVMLRIIGQHLGVERIIPWQAADESPPRVTDVIAQTLLPFLGIYAAFGAVTETANKVIGFTMVRDGRETAFLTGMNPTSLERILLVAGIIASVYVVRRGLDLAYGRTGWRPIGLAAAFAEAFFLLVILIGGSRLVFWASSRIHVLQVWAWIEYAWHGLVAAFAQLAIDLPAAVDAVASFVATVVWPMLVIAMAQPVLWLAVAALIHGSKVLSLAELWQRGQPLPPRPDLVLRSDLAAGPTTKDADDQPAGRGRRALLEVQELFFGDIDDKYLPTVQSLRLLLKAGIPFLGAYVLVYNVVRLAQLWLEFGIEKLIGGHRIEFWVTWDPLLDLAAVPLEIVRVTLLAVAFERCLTMFRERGVAATATSDAAPDPAPVGGES